jgi:hypothetical protein
VPSEDNGLVGIVLRVRSAADLTPLALTLPFSCDPPEPDSDGSWRITVPLDDELGIDAATAELTHALSALPDRERELFTDAAERWLDVGISNRNGAAVCGYQISPETLAALAANQIALVISWYWPYSETKGL